MEIKYNTQKRSKSCWFGFSFTSIFHDLIIIIGIISKAIEETIEVPGALVIPGTSRRGGAPLLVGDHVGGETPFEHLLLRVVNRQAVLAAAPELHHAELAVTEVVEALELLNRPLEPLHQEYPWRQPVWHYHQVQIVVSIVVKPVHVYVPPQWFKETCPIWNSMKRVFSYRNRFFLM